MPSLVKGIRRAAVSVFVINVCIASVVLPSAYSPVAGLFYHEIIYETAKLLKNTHI